MCLMNVFRFAGVIVPESLIHCRYDMQVLCTNCGECKIPKENDRD